MVSEKGVLTFSMIYSICDLENKQYPQSKQSLIVKPIKLYHWAIGQKSVRAFRVYCNFVQSRWRIRHMDDLIRYILMH